MQSDLFDEIIKDIKIDHKDEDSEEKIVFGKKGYTSFVIDKVNFEEIDAKNSKDIRKIAFVDGGNCEIIGSTDFSVQFIRVYCCVFEDGKKIDDIKNEFFVLVSSFIENEDVFYKIKTYPLKGNSVKGFSINSMDKNISEGGKRGKIGKVGDIVRRIGEVKTAEQIIEASNVDAVIFDGTLECNSGEKELLDKVYENALIKDVIICALAKTTNLFTDKGKNALAYINSLGEGVWCFSDFVDIEDTEHNADMSIIKMNEKSKHCFRFEIFNRQKEHKQDVLSNLMNNCRDVSFPGYPYGLILADKYARVSNKEKEYLKSLFLSKAGKDIDGLLESNNAHDILDSFN